MPFKHGARIGPMLIAGLALPAAAQADEPGSHVQPGPGVSVSMDANASAQAHGSGSGAVKSDQGGNAAWSKAGVAGAGRSGLTCGCSTEGGHASGHAGGQVNGHANGASNGHANGAATGHANGHVNAHANGHANGNAVVHTGAHGNAHENGHSNGHANGQSTSRANNKSHGDGNAGAHAGGSAHSNGWARGRGATEEHVGAGVGEWTRSNGCRVENSAEAAPHNGWRFRLTSGRFGEGESAHVVIAASRKGAAHRESESKTVAHATESVRTPNVPSTVSANGMNGHGAGNGGNAAAPFVPGQGETAAAGMAPAAAASPPGLQLVAGTQFAGNGARTGATAPASGTTPGGTAQSPGTAVAGLETGAGGVGSNGGAANGVGATAPGSAFATRRGGGSLPFTGLELVWVLIAAAGCLTSGLALRRVASSQS